MAKKPGPKKRRFEDSGRKLFHELDGLLADDKSRRAATLSLANKAAGAGTPENRAKRVERRYSEDRDSGIGTGIAAARAEVRAAPASESRSYRCECGRLWVLLPAWPLPMQAPKPKTAAAVSGTSASIAAATGTIIGRQSNQTAKPKVGLQRS